MRRLRSSSYIDNYTKPKATTLSELDRQAQESDTLTAKAVHLDDLLSALQEHTLASYQLLGRHTCFSPPPRAIYQHPIELATQLEPGSREPQETER